MKFSHPSSPKNIRLDKEVRKHSVVQKLDGRRQHGVQGNLADAHATVSLHAICSRSDIDITLICSYTNEYQFSLLRRYQAAKHEIILRERGWRERSDMRHIFQATMSRRGLNNSFTCLFWRCSSSWSHGCGLRHF